MSLYSMLSRRGPSGFGYASTAEDVTRDLSLAGKSILVTGSTSGLGLETARVLALRGAHVMGTARTEAKAREALAPLGKETTPLACELADPQSVRACVETVKKSGKKLDAIICNAGIMALPKREAAFGYELQFFTNHIGHFILTTGLVDSLTENGRVVMLSSAAHKNAPKEGIQFDNLSGERGYSPWAAYGQSKLANILFAKQLAKRFAGSKRTANAVHPGVIATNLGRHMGAPAQIFFAIANPLALKTPGEGAATETYVAVHPDAAAITGKYWADCNVKRPRADAEDEALAARLWEESEKIVAKV